MLEGGVGEEGRKNPSQRQGRVGRKKVRKTSVGIHLFGEIREGGILIYPNTCLLQMPIIDLSKLVDLILVTKI